MTQNNKPEEKEETKSSSSLPVFDFIFGLLDRLFKDGATGKILAGRVLTIVVLFALFMIWSKGDSYMQMYKDASFENYASIVQKEKDKRFDSIVQEQLQIAHVASGADFSAIYVFRPKNLNYFVDMGIYEGKLPPSLDARNLGGYPIDKTSDEYSTHLAGLSYETKENFTYLPTTKDEKGVSYMYSCPYFNLSNVYSGTISLYWYNQPKLTTKRLFTVCNQAARVIGRAR